MKKILPGYILTGNTIWTTAAGRVKTGNPMPSEALSGVQTAFCFPTVYKLSLFLDRNNDLIYLKRLEDMIMGFWGSVGKAAKAVGEGLIEAGNEHKALKMEYAEKSSEELHEIVKSDGFFKNSTREKGAAYAVLKERGEV